MVLVIIYTLFSHSANDIYCGMEMFMLTLQVKKKKKKEKQSENFRLLSNITQNKVIRWDLTSGLHGFKDMLFCCVTQVFLDFKYISLELSIVSLWGTLSW